MSEDFSRPQVHDIAAERAVLGAMMLSPDALGECLEMLTPAAFYRPAHQIVFEAMAALAADAVPADAHTVRARLERDASIGKVGGPLALHDLISAVPSAANAPWYARKLLDHQAQRDLDTASARIRQVAADPSLDRQERIDRAYEALDEIAGAAIKTGAVPVCELATPFLKSLEDGPDTAPGIPLPWADTERLVPDLREGQVAVIGGRPGAGKSVSLVEIAAHAALRLGHRVLAVTLEMSQDEYLERLYSAEARVDLRHIRDRAITDDEWDRIAKAHADIARCADLVIHEGPQMTVQALRAELRAMRRSGRPAEMVTLDYLQLMEGAEGSRDGRQGEVSAVSRKLKLLAKEFGVPLVIGAQLNRGPEQRSDRRPMLADIRESGAIENDADIVILLYRDDMYFEDSAHSGEVDFIVAKNRQGPKGTVSLAFQGHYSRIRDMAREWTPHSTLGGDAA